jgi:hypothetical protein
VVRTCPRCGVAHDAACAFTLRSSLAQTRSFATAYCLTGPKRLEALQTRDTQRRLELSLTELKAQQRLLSAELAVLQATSS